MALIKLENKVEKLKKMLLKLKTMMMADPFNLSHKCLIQVFIKAYNETITLTTSLGVFKEG